MIYKNNDIDKLSSEKIKIHTKENLNENYNEKMSEKKTKNQNVQEISQKPNFQYGSKLLTFIKTKPILFALIVAGTVGIVTVAIAVPLALKNKDKNNKDSNNEKNDNHNDNDNDYIIVDNFPKFNDIITINNRKIVDIDIIKNSMTNVYNNIKSKREQCSEISCFCSYLEEISTDKSDEEKVYLAY